MTHLARVAEVPPSPGDAEREAGDPPCWLLEYQEAEVRGDRVKMEALLQAREAVGQWREEWEEGMGKDIDREGDTILFGRPL